MKARSRRSAVLKAKILLYILRVSRSSHEAIWTVFECLDSGIRALVLCGSVAPSSRGTARREKQWDNLDSHPGEENLISTHRRALTANIVVR
jgi:hypothetical protein